MGLALLWHGPSLFGDDRQDHLCRRFLTAELQISGAQLDLGAPISGARKGPDKIREFGVVNALNFSGRRVSDLGNFAPLPEMVLTPDSNPKNNAAVEWVNQQVAVATHTALMLEKIPVTIGGDHSLLAGSGMGSLSFFNKNRQRLGLLHIDPHADINTPRTTLTGNYHGMPVAKLLGLPGTDWMKSYGYSGVLRPENLAYVGLSDVDPKEWDILRARDILFFTREDIEQLGLEEVMGRAIERVSSGTSGFHFSFDMDSMDTNIAPGVSTRVPGGFTFNQGMTIMDKVRESGGMRAMDLVELNPDQDEEDKTARLAADLLIRVLRSK